MHKKRRSACATVNLMKILAGLLERLLALRFAEELKRVWPKSDHTIHPSVSCTAIPNRKCGPGDCTRDPLFARSAGPGGGRTPAAIVTLDSEASFRGTSSATWRRSREFRYCCSRPRTATPPLSFLPSEAERVRGVTPPSFGAFPVSSRVRAKDFRRCPTGRSGSNGVPRGLALAAVSLQLGYNRLLAPGRWLRPGPVR